MSVVFLTSDTHFGHANICKFTKQDGTPRAYAAFKNNIL